LVTNVPGACGYVERNEVKAGARGVHFSVLGGITDAGTYPVSPGAMPAQATYMATDDACKPLFATSPFAQPGSTLVVRSITADTVDGSYALDFGAGRVLTGDFRATLCSPLGHPNPTCVP
jgi:hypothetical protein